MSVLLSCGLVFLFSPASQAAFWPLGKAERSESKLPNILVDNQPINRSTTGLLTSFAPVVKKVVPSVVKIFTTQKIRVPEGWGFPFFNDPFFRRFFGLPDEDNQGSNPRRVPRAPQQRRAGGLGSGVIVTADGYILTNNHVVDVADEIKVMLGNDKKEFTAKVVGKDPLADIALIKIPARDLPPITFTDSDKAEVGDIVLAVGNPFDLTQTVTMGIISAVGRKDVGIEEYEDFIQTDAAINPGNSGGALVDILGRLVGINTAIVSPGRPGNLGIGFAVPSNMARYAMEQLLAHGRVIRGFLGVSISEVTPELATAFKLPQPTGALVEQVNPDSPAEKAGIKPGDVILEFNGNKVNDPRDLRLAVSQTQPGTRVTLKIWRDGHERVLEATLKERETPEASSGGSGGEQQPASDFIPGVEIADLTPLLRQQFGIPPSLQGVLVTNVEPDSPAAGPGRDSLRPGDVIVEVARRPVRSVREVLTVAKQVQEDRLLLRVWTRNIMHYVVIKRTSEP
ncbi:DegQ family serine endoprotease [Candidatus Methylacidithermus pantelleriae]|uniref:DegQ family serine endoprotease n=1 Tax=Candidatus Methylacidithermus pantelleriae TaxID=2744239 RepID=UPI001F3A4483|nr:DegQ family serine endoprotease [Candidatus Methylacidithermus pantelleriae]